MKKRLMQLVPLNTGFQFLKWRENSIGGASRRAILVLFKSARKNMACSDKKSDAI